MVISNPIKYDKIYNKIEYEVMARLLAGLKKQRSFPSSGSGELFGCAEAVLLSCINIHSLLRILFDVETAKRTRTDNAIRCK